MLFVDWEVITSLGNKWGLATGISVIQKFYSNVLLFDHVDIKTNDNKYIHTIGFSTISSPQISLTEP